MLTQNQTDTLARLAEAFTPHQPIHLAQFLAGRLDVLYSVTDAINTEGLHVILFGERGTGKTSVARILAQQLQEATAEGRRCILISASTSDDYASIWSKVTREILVAQRQLGLVQHATATIIGRMESEVALTNPNDVRLFLESLPNSVVIFIDEFDRTRPGSDVHRLMADTIKLLSDSLVKAKLIIVGVGESIEELMSEHRSISRNLAQVRVESMTEDELSQIVRNGYSYASMEYEDGLDLRMAKLSQGYPHYTHLLGLWAGRRAVEAGRKNVTQSDLEHAIPDTLKNAEGGLQHQYEKAVLSSKKNALFKEVLLACALVGKDQLGRFSASAIADPLAVITGKDFPLGAYQGHLAKFCEEDRGPILKKSGKRRSYRWKFTNPQLIPYVILQGMQQGYIPASEPV